MIYYCKFIREEFAGFFEQTKGFETKSAYTS